MALEFWELNSNSLTATQKDHNPGRAFLTWRWGLSKNSFCSKTCDFLEEPEFCFGIKAIQGTLGALVVPKLAGNIWDILYVNSPGQKGPTFDSIRGYVRGTQILETTIWVCYWQPPYGSFGKSGALVSTPNGRALIVGTPTRTPNL